MSIKFIMQEIFPWALFFSFILGTFETILLIRENGRLRRGFLIWKRRLSKDEIQFLLKVKKNIVVYLPVEFSLKPFKQGFLLSRKNEILIQFRTPKWRTGWPYVGFVNLGALEPCLEYRAAFLMHVIFIGVFFIVSSLDISKTWFVFPFITGLMYLNFSIETKAIDNFLLSQVEENNKQKKNGLIS